MRGWPLFHQIQAEPSPHRGWREQSVSLRRAAGCCSGPASGPRLV